MRLNDLQKDLNMDIDIDKDIAKTELKLDALNKNDVLRDIYNWLEELDIPSKKYASISNGNQARSNTSFDSIVKKDEGKDVDLRYIDIIKGFIRPQKNKRKKKQHNINKVNKENEMIGTVEKPINKVSKSKWKPSNFLKYFFTLTTFKNLSLKFWTVIFIVFIILYIDKIIVVSYINSWYKKIISLKENPTDIKYLKKKLNDAKFDFVVWYTLFKPFLFLDNQSVRNWDNFISWWREITNIWNDLVNIFSKTKDFISDKGIENTYLTNLLNNLRWEFQNTEKRINKAIYYYEQVSDLGDDYLEKKLKENINRLHNFKNYLSLINLNMDTILNILWQEKEKKYLVVFQNSDEIRPTGWFMWSMWIVTLFRWKIKSFEKKDVYQFEWDLKKADYDRLKAPKWIIKLTDKFWLRDSNYFVNLKDSSENIRFFIEKSWNDVDGIIYLNQNILLEFLKETGWIEVEWINEAITSENFSELMSILVEAKLFKKWTLWTPKKILFDFMEVFFAKLKDEKDYSKYWKILLENLNKREILFYSFKKEENEIFELLWLWWKIDYQESLDFIYVVYTSLSWNKSDRYREIKYKKDIIVNPDCSINTDFIISSTHFFSQSKEDEISALFDEYNIEKTASSLDIQWRGDNYQFVRVLLPKEAIVDNPGKYNIQSLGMKKSLEFFMRTKRSEVATEVISYKIMNNICRKYDFILYKQPWIKSYDINITENWQTFENFWINKDLYYNIEK